MQEQCSTVADDMNCQNAQNAHSIVKTMSEMPTVVHQHACCCGAMQMADGTWNQLQGITDRIVSFVTFDADANMATLHLVSHGYCPTCLDRAWEEVNAHRAAQRAMGGVNE